MRFKKIKVNFSWLFLLAMLFLFSLIIFKLYLLQIVHSTGTVFNEKFKKIPPLRGNIYLRDKDGNLFPAALSYYLYNLYFYPPKAKNIEEELKILSSKLNQQFPLEEIKKSSKSIILAKDLTDKQKKEIEKLKFDSVFFEEKVVRVYPLENTLATVLGFTRFDEKENVLVGQYGLEKYYDEILKGKPGYRNNFSIIENPRQGHDLILNIDYYLQRKIEEILKEAIENFRAQGGLIVVVEAKTGNILGVAELPSYNPNKFNEIKDYSLFISRLSKNYEPGSVMKPFFYAAAFQEGLVTPTTTYEDKGYVVLNNWKIENFDKKGRGIVDLTTALEQSLNTGSVYISQILGKTRFLKYIKAFRLDKKAEIDFPILEEPNFKNLIDPGREVNFGTASFGQGVALSPLNLIQGFLAFVNQGKILKLNFVREISYPDGSQILIKPQIITQVLNQSTLEKILPILEGVVENQAKKAKIKGYRIAGKTGSALIPAAKENPQNPSGYTDEAITTFIGFFPVSNPQYIVLVRLDKPAKGLLAFGTAAPTFRKVAEFLINYYNIEPDRFNELL